MQDLSVTLYLELADPWILRLNWHDNISSLHNYDYLSITYVDCVLFPCFNWWHLSSIIVLQMFLAYPKVAARSELQRSVQYIECNEWALDSGTLKR